MIRYAIALGVLIGLVGCGADELPADPCFVPPTSVISYGDCGAQLADGTEAVVFCGQLPSNGTPGTLLAAGCQVQIGTSRPVTATCLSVCP